MDDQNSRQRHKGLLTRGIDAANAGRTLAQGVKVARAAGAIGANAWIVVGAIVSLFLITYITTFTSGEAVGIPPGQPTSAGGGGLSAGSFPQTKLTSGDYLPITFSPSQESCVSKYEPLGPCSVGNLMQYFENNRNKAIMASLICNAESTGNPDVRTNDNCGTNDYSVGLFQINAVANCSINDVSAYSNTASCNSTINYSVRAQCENDWKTSSLNIEMAYGLSSKGTFWGLWGTWGNSNGNSPAVGSILTQCGISF